MVQNLYSIKADCMKYQHSDRTYHVSDERLKAFRSLSTLEKLQWIQASNTFLMAAKRQVCKKNNNQEK